MERNSDQLQGSVEVADDSITSITNQNIMGTVCELLEKDENVKKRVRTCVFSSFIFRLILSVFIAGIVIGVLFGHNYHPYDTVMRNIEARFHLVPKDIPDN